jgi:hypothetical protein
MTTEQKGAINNSERIPIQSPEEAAAEYGLSAETVRRLRERFARRGGLFYLEDFIDDVTEVSVKRFRRLASAKSGPSQDDQPW